MIEHRSPLDRLEARLEAQAARIDELYRLLEASPQAKKCSEPRRSQRRPVRATAGTHR
jgi:hypothetical protein